MSEFQECNGSCPDLFYRKGNVEIYCKRYGIPLYEDMDSMLEDFKTLLTAELKGSQFGKGEVNEKATKQKEEG